MTISLPLVPVVLVVAFVHVVPVVLVVPIVPESQNNADPPVTTQQARMATTNAPGNTQLVLL